MKQPGDAPRASTSPFIVVPLVGAFFVDVANAVTIQTFVGWLAR